MKRFTLMLSIILLVNVIAAAQDSTKSETKPAAAKTTAAALPSVDAILDKYVKAMGGEAAIKKFSSRTAKGTMEIEGVGLNGPLELYAKAPDKSAIVIDLTGFGLIQEVYDGAKAYAIDPQNGLREKSGSELARAKRSSDFYEPLNMKKNFSKLELKGTQTVNSTETYKVVATPTEGEPESYYFAVDSGLLLRTDLVSDTPQGTFPVEVYFSDYKDVDGVKIAYTLRQVTSAFIAVIKLNEVKHDVEIDDAKFAKPRGQ